MERETLPAAQEEAAGDETHFGELTAEGPNVEIGERVAQLETKTEIALAGVANFKAFQTEARDFFSRYDEREKQRERISRKHTRRLNILIAIAGLVASAVIATCSYFALHANETRSVLNDLNLSTSHYQYTLAERTTK